MDFTRKLKVRLYTAVVVILIGAALNLVGIFKAEEMASAFGSMFLVIGIARIVQYKRITRNEDTLHEREVAETDERNVMLWTKARSLAFSVYILFAAAAVVLLYLMDMGDAAKMISYSLFSFIIIYWVCYFIISRRY